MSPVRILFWLALAVPLLAFWPPGQGEASTDWSKEVERACTSPRYGLRLAAARKVAAAGAAAVPAIREFARRGGPNALPSALVEAIADQPQAEAPVVELLLEWAQDRDFFWRAGAMRGLALRARNLPDQAWALPALFARHHDDPAWLMRTHARLGTALLGTGNPLDLPEADPRAVVRLRALLLAQGQVPPLQPLFDALADERTFLGVPWGQQTGQLAHQALKAWLGDSHPLPNGGSFADKDAAIAALLDAARAKSGQQLTVPAPRLPDPDAAFAGGIELLSCKHGDVFLRWSADGLVRAGIDGRLSVQLPTTGWEALTRERAQLDLAGNLGVIICDTLRLCWKSPDVDVKVAPNNLPAATTNWLKHLAQAIEEAGQPRLAETLRTGLSQFTAR